MVRRTLTNKNSLTMTNLKFSETDEEFRRACEEANVKPTARQASKWRMKKGIVWKKLEGGRMSETFWKAKEGRYFPRTNK